MEGGYEPKKEETQEFYLKIYAHHAVGRFSQKQISEHFKCSEDTIRNAIQWVINNKIRFDSKTLIEVAKEALETRLRILNNDLIRIKEGNPINWNAYIGVSRLITDNEKLLWQFQSIIQGSGGITINNVQNVSMLEKSERVNDIVSCMEPLQQKALSFVLGAINEKKEIKIDLDEDNDVARIQVGLAHGTDNVKRLPE